MQDSLTGYVDELKNTTASKAAMEQELKIASDIQKQMLPKTYPPFPERTDIDIYGEVVTAREVGGDLYDFFIRDEKLFFSIGDVAGKGVPASLVMAVTRSMFRSASMQHTSPKLIVESINRSVCQSNDSFMFVTLFMGVLDLSSGRMIYTNAGHEPPVLVGANTRFLPIESNIPLGLRDEWEYTEQEVTIVPGTTVFLYTDGFTEAETVDKRQYGRDRMFKEVIRLARLRLDSRSFVKNIRQTERSFVEEIPQKDDISLLAIKYIGNIDDTLYNRSILLSNNIQEVRVLAIFIEGICEDMCISDTMTSGINLALEEAVVNVMNYAYPEGMQGDILLEVTGNEQELKFVLKDSGVPFDPTAYKEVDAMLYAESQTIGGLGIHLMRHYTDGMSYERTDGHNVLTMIKKLKNNKE
jgi:sigma-B regulation protein RsbU (phosphoserine phosphatase)